MKTGSWHWWAPPKPLPPYVPPPLPTPPYVAVIENKLNQLLDGEARTKALVLECLQLLRNPPRPPQRGHITLGRPVVTDKEGKFLMAQYPTDQTLYFPILVNGASPPSVDTFTVTGNNDTVFVPVIGAIPAGSPDPNIVAGNPAVVANALTRAGAPGLAFTVNDGQGDLPGGDTFDYIAPVVV